MKNVVSNKGFALAEVMLGLSILAVVFMVAANLLFNSVRTHKFVVNEFQAYQLAQEGIELARMARDSNWRRNIAWDGGVPVETKAADFSSDGFYKVSLDEKHKVLVFDKSSVSEFDLELEEFALYQHVLGKNIFFSHVKTGAELSGYKRAVQISRDSQNPKIVKVKSIAAWNAGTLGWQTVEISTELTDWKKGL